MGMPISSYTVLKTIAAGGSAWENETVDRALAPFSLYAFIIYDPVTHHDFGQTLATEFDYLDHITGNRLLFFALVDPPVEWLSHARHRRYYSAITAWEAHELASPANALRSQDPSLTAFGLSQSLGIPYDSLPCILVANNFRSKSFFWFKTCSEHVERQLAQLGYIATRFTGQSQRDDPVDALMKGQDTSAFDLCAAHGEGKLPSSLAQALSDFLSYLVAGQHSDPLAREGAAQQARAAITHLYAQLQSEKGSHLNEITLQRLGNRSVQILSLFALLHQDTSDDLYGFVPIRQEYLERESQLILRTAYKVTQLLFAEQDRAVDFVLEATDDFSPGVIGLAKVFEREINLSIVHWLRKEQGVDLPTYFARHQPGKTARVEDINLNSQRDGAWLPPELGRAEMAFRKHSNARLPVGWTHKERDGLLEHWKTIRERRNDAAHDRVVHQDAVNTVLDSLAKLGTDNYFQRMYDMKCEFRGG